MSTCTVDIVRVAPHLVSTNNAPTAVELASIETAIANEESLIAHLKQQGKAAKARVRQYEAVLSPCRRLPSDILGEIFLQLSHREIHSDHYSYQKALKKLVLVCKKWRDAACATPRLWSSIVIEVKKNPFNIEALGAWLCRSGNIPKDLVICSPPCDVPRDPRLTQGMDYRHQAPRPCFSGNVLCVLASSGLVEALAKMTGECNSVLLACKAPGCAQNFSRLLSHAVLSPGSSSSWHSTKSFTLSGRYWKNWPTSPQFLSRLVPNSITTLKLRLSDSFDGHTARTSSAELELSPTILERLTLLELSPNICGRQLYPLLRQCVNLQKLTLDHEDGCFEENYGPPYEQALERGTILPNLRHLNILNAINVTGLEVLKMPALVELSIRFSEVDEAYVKDGQGQEAQFRTLVNGHLETNTSLRTLTIHGGNFAGDTLFNALRTLKALTVLTLSRSYYPRDMFVKLSTPVLCLPELKTLKLLELYSSVEKFPHLSEFIEEQGIAFECSRYDGEVWGSDGSDESD